MSAPDRIVFRMPLDGGPCEAFIVDASANPGHVMCYAHVGQHGEASLGYYRYRTRPATPEEYRGLQRELNRIGYIVRPMRRMQRGASC